MRSRQRTLVSIRPVTGWRHAAAVQLGTGGQRFRVGRQCGWTHSVEQRGGGDGHHYAEQQRRRTVAVASIQEPDRSRGRHAVGPMCSTLYDPASQDAIEDFATAWAISRGFTGDGNGVSLHGKQTRECVAAGGTCPTSTGRGAAIGQRRLLSSALSFPAQHAACRSRRVRRPQRLSLRSALRHRDRDRSTLTARPRHPGVPP